MAEVLFYHLTVSSLDEALPGLLEKSVARGWRAVVQAGSEERRQRILDPGFRQMVKQDFHGCRQPS